jgi:hypothetical protein
MPDACAVGPSRAADQSRLPLSLESTFRRAQNWNRFALIATINPKVRSIDGDHRQEQAKMLPRRAGHPSLEDTPSVRTPARLIADAAAVAVMRGGVHDTFTHE